MGRNDDFRYQKSSHRSHRQHYQDRQNHPQNRYQAHNRHTYGDNAHLQQHQNYRRPDAPTVPPPLPPGWFEAKDPSTGKTYFANPQTRETQWDRPVMKPPPPPAMPPPPAPHWNVQVRVPASAAQSYDGIRTDQATGRSTGEGNKLYTAGGSAAMSNVAVEQPEKIVMVARSMLEKAQAFPERTTASDLELHSVNPGQIVDLCKLQRRVHQQLQQEMQKEQRRTQLQQQLQHERRNRHGDSESAYDNAKNDAIAGGDEELNKPLPSYTPINPFAMPLSGGLLLDRPEPGRLDVRLNSLRDELKAFGYAPINKNI